MTKVLTFLYRDEDREKACKWIKAAPKGSSVELSTPKRTPNQNDLMWSLLTQVSIQMRKQGKHYTTEQWKSLFMHALGQEVDFLPSLDGSTFVPIGYSSSALRKDQMSELIELIFSWGAQHGVVFKEAEND